MSTVYEPEMHEQRALWALVGEVRDRLLIGLVPNGFSTGFSDSGEGPTAPHVHVHLIPRRRGDKVELLDGIDWVTDECVIEQKR